MSLHPVAGMRIYIGDTPMDDQATNFAEADFVDASPAIVWTEMDGWETWGKTGDAVADIATILINRSRTVHQKGAADAPPMSNVFAYIPGNAGQIAVVAAGQPSEKNNYPFRIKGNETSDVSGFEPSYLYFIGLVMGTPEQGGGANTVRKIEVNIQINSNIVNVAAG